MQYTYLDKENLKISKLGLGTKIFVEQIKVDKKIFRNYVNNSLNEILISGIESGINLIECASFYPIDFLISLSEKIQQVRKSVVLNFRIGYKLSRENEIVKEKTQYKVFLTKKDVIAQVENLLTILKTDYIDIITICGLDKEKEYISDVVDAFYILNSRGYVRYSGIYIANADLLRLERLIEKFNFSQITYNILNQW
ncbi:MAG: aldo/keto reductase, partial [Planctomycetota bacterium]